MKRALIGWALVLPLVLGCAGSGAPATTDLPASTSPPASLDDAVGGPTADPAGAAQIVPVGARACDLLTTDEVAAATGFAVQDVVDDPPIGCVFDLGEDAGVDIFVTIEDGQGRLSGAANLFESYTDMVANGEAASVSGVGEQAVCCAFRTIAVDAGGGRYIAIGVNGGYAQLAEPLDALTALAQSAVGRL